MTAKDMAELILQLATLATTVYFTRQLVQNDNRREERTRSSELRLRAKQIFSLYGGSPGSLQTVATGLGKQHPEEVDLLINAYEDAYYENPSSLRPVEEFLISVWGYSDSNKKIWPHGYELVDWRRQFAPKNIWERIEIRLGKALDRVNTALSWDP